MRYIKYIVITSLLVVAPAFAYDWQASGAHVTVLEASYMPSSITFAVDASMDSSCPAGAWLTYRVQGPDTASQLENIKAVYAMLLGAKLSGQTLDIYGNDAGCLVTYVHLR